MFIDISKIFKSLADETRLRIIRIFFNGNYSVNEILFVIGGKQSNISHHLKILQDSEILISKKEGANVFYRLNNFDNEAAGDLITFIKKNERAIPHYNEDTKRLETISQKRKKQAEDYFNSVGLDFDFVQSNLFKNIYSVEEALSLFGQHLNTILDIGCGTGRNLPLISKFADKIIGIDSSPKMIQLSDHICKKNNLNYELKISDIYQMPFHNSSIDGVFANMVFHHIPEPLKAITEINRIISDNGKFILIDLLSHEDQSMTDNYADLWLGFSEEEITKWLSDNNFHITNKIIKTDQNDSKNVIILVCEKKRN